VELKVAVLIDEPRFNEDSILYRRVGWDAIGGRDRVPPGEIASFNGNSFSDYPETKAREMGYPGPCMSVASAEVLTVNGSGPERLVDGFNGYGLVSLRVGDLRNLTRVNGQPCPQGVMLVPEDGQPWHAVVFCLSGHQRTKPIKEAIRAIAEWVIPLRNDQ